VTREMIFQVVKAKVLEVLVDVSPDAVVPGVSLLELGANSVDRVEISMAVLEQLDLRIPRVELHGVSNLQGLVDVLHRHLGGGESP